MAISYAKVSKTQYIFRQLTGLTTSEFEKIVKGKREKTSPIQRPKDNKKRKKSYSGKKKTTIMKTEIVRKAIAIVKTCF